MKPDDVDLDDVARLVLSELAGDPRLEGDRGPEAGTRLEREPALRIIRNEVRGLIAALESDDSVAAPVDLIRKTAALLRQRGLATLVAAVVVYDSRSRPQSGFRSTGARCHITFDAEGEKIDLHLEPNGDRWRVRGQIGEHRSATTGVVYFVASDVPEVVTDAPIDSFGYFQTDAPPGYYDVQVTMPDCTILLERVWIG